MARYAITGSSGMVGTALSARLKAAGHEVVAMKRGNPDDPSAMWNPDAGWVRATAFDGVDAIVHLAGASIGEGRWNAERKRVLRTSRVDATNVLTRHLGTLSARPKVMVAASAIGIYGDRGDEMLAETSAKGSGFLAELTADWEKATLAAKELEMRVVALRFGVILDKDEGAFPRMVMPFKFGAGGKLGSGKQWFSWITLTDAVRAIEHALGSGIEGPVNATAPGPLRNADLAKAIGRQLKRPALAPMPGFALRLIVGESADELILASQRVEPIRLKADGFEFEHPDISTALAAVLR